MSLRNDIIAVLAVQEVSQSTTEIAELLSASVAEVDQILTQLLWEKKISYDVIGFLKNGAKVDETYWKLAEPGESTRILVKPS